MAVSAQPTVMLLLLTLIFSLAAGGAYARELSFLHADGSRFADEEGRPVALRGCNLGNWLLLEMWMLSLERRSRIRDQYDLETVLAERFGQAGKDRLMELYRENWIGPRDFEMVRSFGMNCIRLPFNYRLLEDDDRPMELKPDAFRWLDRGLEMAEEAGLYVILDMHGVPGGQSADHTTGQRGRNQLWESDENRKRTAWLWTRIADRYRDRSVVAAYNMINEPYGSTVEQNTAVQEQVLAAIREADRRHIVLASGNLSYLDSIRAYGTPAEKGWENVGFTCNFYPGLFGQPACIESHQRFMARDLQQFAAYIDEVGAPFLVGELNPAYKKVGAPWLTRHYCDLFNERAWAATFWNYKIVKGEGGAGPDTWYMVTNAEPLPRVNFRTASLGEIEDHFRGFGTMEYAVYDDMRQAMNADPDPYLAFEPLFDDDALVPVPPGALTAGQGGGAGLKGEYFANAELQGQPAFVRTDPAVDFDWGEGGPGNGLPADGFSVRWTGTLTAPGTGRVRIGVVADDGVRFRLDGHRLVDEWQDRPESRNTVFFDVEAGRRYEVEIDYYERAGQAVARFLWNPALLAAN